MYGIDEIMDMLDWNNSEEIQQKGRELAKSIRSINVFVLPYHDPSSKNVWENCAKILANRSDETLKPYIGRLLEWTEDLNWPGAEIILNRLKAFSETEMLAFNVRECVRREIALDNKLWLNYLSELLDNEKLKHELPKDVLDTLQKHYHNWDWWDTE